MIYCTYCDYSNGAIAGTAREREFFRAMDSTKADQNAVKDFYCSTKCYLDRYFVRVVCEKAGIKTWRDARVDLKRGIASDPYVEHFVNENISNYDSIVAGANSMPALRSFRERDVTKQTAGANSMHVLRSFREQDVTKQTIYADTEKPIEDWADEVA